MLENLSAQEIKKQFQGNKNLRLVTYIIGGILIAIIGFFLYRQFISKPGNVKSQDSYWVGQNLVDKDSTDAAISELSAVVKKQDGYVGGEIGQYLLARQFMNKGEYKKALNELEGVKLKDTYVSAMSLGLQGDCHSEMGNYKSAVEKYTDAAERETNEMTTPNYLFKAGLCAEELKDFEAALEFYQQIKDDFPNAAQKKTIDKYIARVSNQKTK